MDDASFSTEATVTVDGFDRERLLELVNRVERDIALVESAMNDIEQGDQAGVEAVMSALGTP